MNNPAPVAYPVHEIVRDRWSAYALDASRGVDEATLRSLLEAARWAPSSYNEQPWSYVVARREDAEGFARVLACLVPPNARWAKDAAVLVISAARPLSERNGQPNPHAWHDVGAASAWMTVEATARGLIVHQMAGIDAQACRRELGIPEAWEPVAGLAIGYPGKIEQLPENLQTRDRAPRTRKPQEAFVFQGTWGERLDKKD